MFCGRRATASYMCRLRGLLTLPGTVMALSIGGTWSLLFRFLRAVSSRPYTCRMLRRPARACHPCLEWTSCAAIYPPRAATTSSSTRSSATTGQPKPRSDTTVHGVSGSGTAKSGWTTPDGTTHRRRFWPTSCSASETAISATSRSTVSAPSGSARFGPRSPSPFQCGQELARVLESTLWYPRSSKL